MNKTHLKPNPPLQTNEKTASTPGIHYLVSLNLTFQEDFCFHFKFFPSERKFHLDGCPPASALLWVLLSPGHLQPHGSMCPKAVLKTHWWEHWSLMWQTPRPRGLQVISPPEQCQHRQKYQSLLTRGCVLGRRTLVCPSECFCKGKSDCKQWHTVFQLCESDPGVGCDNYHHFISAYGEAEDAEHLPTGSTDEDTLFRWWGEHCEGSYARGSENFPWLIFFTGTENPKGLS